MYQNNISIDKKISNTITTLLKKLDSTKSMTVAVSGGVDSAVVAKLVNEAGLKYKLVYANCWEDIDIYNCNDWPQEQVVKLASFLNADLEIVDLRIEYKKDVFDLFLDGYKNGITPNPDVLCNSKIKFGVLAKKYLSAGGGFLTGHYAKIGDLGTVTGFNNENSADQYREENASTRFVGTALDNKKDQSYYLCDIFDSSALKNVYLPLGDLYKSEVRQMAKYFNLPNAMNPDSQGICFIGDVKLKKFLSNYIKPKKGDVYDLQMNKIGEHPGAHFFTIGQRHGFKIFKYSPNPLYVVKKDIAQNYIIVGAKDNCYFDEVSLQKVRASTIFKNLLEQKVDLYLRVRSLGEFYKIASVNQFDQNISIVLKEKIFAVASGQYGVIYADFKNSGYQGWFLDDFSNTKYIVAQGIIQ